MAIHQQTITVSTVPPLRPSMEEEMEARSTEGP
jgi:hypothetical protein